MFEYSGMRFSFRKGDWVLYSQPQSKKGKVGIIIRKNILKGGIIYM